MASKNNETKSKRSRATVSESTPGRSVPATQKRRPPVKNDTKPATGVFPKQPTSPDAKPTVATVAEAKQDVAAQAPAEQVNVIIVGGKVIDAPAPVQPVSGKRRKLAWTPARRKAVAEYLAMLQLALRLSDWEILVEFDKPCEEGAVATMTQFEDQYRAAMRFAKDFFDMSPGEMRQTLAHEMLHCHLFTLHHNAERTVEALGGKRAVKAFIPGMDAMVEITTDNLANAFAPLLPPLEIPER